MSRRLRIPPREPGARPKKLTHINGLTKDEITREQLEEHVARLRAEVQKERLERDHLRLECAKIQAFRDRDLQQLQKLKAEEKKLLEECEEDERRHLKSIEGYKQKIKCLQRKHQNTISELKADALRSTEAQQQEQNKVENVLHEEMRALKAETPEHNSGDLVKEIQRAHDEKMVKVKDDLEKQLAETKAKYQKKEELLSRTLGDVKKAGKGKRPIDGIAAVSKNKIAAETKAFVDMMKDDMRKFESLQAEHSDLEQEVKGKEKELRTILDKNKRLVERIEKAEKEYDTSQEKIKFYQAKMVVDTSKKKELDKMKREYQALEEKFSKLQLEKDELDRTVIPTILRTQQRAADKKKTLEKKLKDLTASVERTRAELDSLLSTPGIDRAALDGLTKTAEELLVKCNNAIKKLQTEKAQLSQAHKDLLVAYQAKKKSLGLPVEKL